MKLGRIFLSGTASIAMLLGAAAAQSTTTQSPTLGTATFEDWLDGFRAEAVAAGVSATIIDEAFATVTLNERVFELNDNQPEFAQTIWNYLDRAVSEARIANGRAGYAENRALLKQIEAAYGVDASVLVAIWGLESSYGAIMGNYDSISALATLAWQGRAHGLWTKSVNRRVENYPNGYAARNQLRGSWAGAMGQTQFIPTTYLSYAVDHDGDGKRDIWSNLGDVFASHRQLLERFKIP